MEYNGKKYKAVDDKNVVDACDVCEVHFACDRMPGNEFKCEESDGVYKTDIYFVEVE